MYTPTDLLTSELTNMTGALAAIGALGTAAYGLVDVTKVFYGGVSRAGFGYIKKALKPFELALIAAGGADWSKTLFAHWINGTSLDDQKAVAKSLIHLGLAPDNASKLAIAGRVEGDTLEKVAKDLDEGSALGTDQITMLGRFDAMIDARLDGGYERADQFYRNSAKALAAVFAIILASAGEALIQVSRGIPFGFCEFVTSGGFLLAVLVGAVSVPLAPIAKDISTALQTAVKAMQAAGG